MQKNRKLKKEGKLGILLTLSDVAAKHGVTKEAINYLRKRYYKDEQVSSKNNRIQQGKISVSERSTESLGTRSDAKVEDDPKVGKTN